MATVNVDAIPENTPFGLGWFPIPKSSRRLFVVTEEPHDWRGGSEFDEPEKAYSKFLKISEKLGNAYLWSIYLDPTEVETIGVFVYIQDRKRFERIM